jgi:hypothetical protein
MDREQARCLLDEFCRQAGAIGDQNATMAVAMAIEAT